MKNTIVTAIYYYSHLSRMGGRDYKFEHYENPFTNLLSLNANIIVFSFADEINKIDAFFRKHQFKDYKIIEYDLNNSIFSNSIYKIKEQSLIIDKNGMIAKNPSFLNDRNTHLCLSKIEFLKIAINANYFTSNNYYWIDAGLFHNGIIPNSLGGMERLIRPNSKYFWPINKNNICVPKLIDNLRNNAKLVFIGLTQSYPTPTWWNKVTNITKTIHIIGGFFGGNKDEILKMHQMFIFLTKKVISLNQLTLEEDILSIIVMQNKYHHIKFDTWYHDIKTDSCYYNLPINLKPFYKIFATL